MQSLSIRSVMIMTFAIVGVIIGVVSQFAEKPNVYVQGEIKLDPALEESANGILTLFVVLYDENSPRPMPWGAIRYSLKQPATAGSFHNFILTPANLQVMDTNAPVPKSFRIKARLDVNGQGGMDTPGDLVGELNHVPRGQTGVSLTVNKKIG